MSRPKKAIGSAKKTPSVKKGAAKKAAAEKSKPRPKTSGRGSRAKRTTVNKAESFAMGNSSIDQRLEFLQNGLREIGMMCLKLGEGEAGGGGGASAPSSSLPTATLSESQRAAAAAGAVPLRDFLGVDDLTPEERLVVVDAAIAMLREVFVHLPLKKAMHGIEPIQRLKLLRQRVKVQIASRTAPESARAFHDEMIEIFHSLRDLHTNYMLPAAYHRRTAFLPFLVQDCYEGEPPKRQYLVTKLRPGFVHDTFKVGVTVTHWNGIPIERAVELNAAREAGSNYDARFARGLEALTLRSMSLSAPPDEAWVIIGYESGGQSYELKFQWYVATPAASTAGVDVDDPLSIAGEAAFLMGFDAETLAVQRARRSLFFPEAVDQEQHMAQVMASSAAVNTFALEQAPMESVGSADFSFDYRTEELRAAKRSVLFPDMAAAQAAFGEVAMNESTGDVDPSTTSLLPAFFAFRKVATPAGDVGYIRISSFMTSDANAFVAEFVRITKLLPANGLIIDVRGNGGGNINAGELILQVLTDRSIEPERFHFINTSTTLAICEGNPRFKDWVESIDLSFQTGETYSQGFYLTPIASANSLSEHYKGKVVLIIDALCYSTTDIFAAGFQDHGIGKIMGTCERTGGGGANVWTYDFFSQLPAFPKLPKGAYFRTAIRRSTRVGPKAGVPLEDLGVRADGVPYKRTRRDILGSNEDMIAAAAALL